MCASLDIEIAEGPFNPLVPPSFNIKACDWSTFTPQPPPSAPPRPSYGAGAPKRPPVVMHDAWTLREINIMQPGPPSAQPASMVQTQTWWSEQAERERLDKVERDKNPEHWKLDAGGMGWGREQTDREKRHIRNDTPEVMIARLEAENAALRQENDALKAALIKSTIL